MSLQALRFDPCQDGPLRVQTVVTGATAWVILEGDADASTLAALEEALVGLDLGAATSVRIDVSALVSADDASVRALGAFAGRAREAGREVTTHGIGPTLRLLTGPAWEQHGLGIR